jgi:hypothetical protein
MCGDNLKLEPMSGELEPNSHQNIKMTLIPARFPTNFEGEIQCSIDWETQGDEEKAEMKSMHTNTHASDSQEFLFLRLKKRSTFVSYIFILFSLHYHLYAWHGDPSFLFIGQGEQSN